MLARAVPGPSSSRSVEGYAVDEALQALMGEMMVFLRGLALDQGLTLQQLMLLRKIEAEGPQQPSRIADRYGISRSAVSVEISSLERRGWVSRSPVKGNRRGRLASLTPKAQKALRESHERRRAFLESGLAALSPTERRALTRSLWTVVEHLQTQREASGTLPGRCP